MVNLIAENNIVIPAEEAGIFVGNLKSSRFATGRARETGFMVSYNSPEGGEVMSVSYQQSPDGRALATFRVVKGEMLHQMNLVRRRELLNWISTFE